MQNQDGTLIRGSGGAEGGQHLQQRFADHALQRVRQRGEHQKDRPGDPVVGAEVLVLVPEQDRALKALSSL